MAEKVQVQLRVVQHDRGDEPTLMIHHVFVREDGSVQDKCCHPCIPAGSDLQTLRESLEMMLGALDRPIVRACQHDTQ